MPNPTSGLIVGYTRWIIRFRWPVLIVCVVAALAAAAGMRNLSFTSDFQVFFGPNNPELAAYNHLEDTYTKTDNILFVLQPADKNVFSHGVCS